VLGTLSGSVRSFPYSQISPLREKDCVAVHAEAAKFAQQQQEEEEDDINELLAYVIRVGVENGARLLGVSHTRVHDVHRTVKSLPKRRRERLRSRLSWSARRKRLADERKRSAEPRTPAIER